MTRIIDNDLDFYEGEVQEMKRRLVACHPKDEPYWSKRIDAAEKIYKAMQEYVLLIENHPRKSKD